MSSTSTSNSASPIRNFCLPFFILLWKKLIWSNEVFGDKSEWIWTTLTNKVTLRELNVTKPNMELVHHLDISNITWKWNKVAHLIVYLFVWRLLSNRILKKDNLFRCVAVHVRFYNLCRWLWFGGKCRSYIYIYIYWIVHNLAVFVDYF